MWHFIPKINDLSPLHSIPISLQPARFTFFPFQIDLIWCPVRCIFLGTYPPYSLMHACARANTHFPKGVSQIAHWFPMSLCWTSQKGDRQLLQLASEAITTPPRGRLARRYCASQQKLQRDGKCFLGCKIPNSHTDSTTHTQKIFH